MEGLCISNHCIIRNNKVYVDGELAYSHTEGGAYPEFIKAVYSKFQFNYPKFFKMDHLSKLGFGAAMLLLKEKAEPCNSLKTGVVLANSSSSLDTDAHHFDSIKDKKNYFPSPSVFVYTLPNIMIGEICIYHKLKGENAFFISEIYDAELLCNYINALFGTGKLDCCITGWVEYTPLHYEAVLFFVAPCNDKKTKFEPETIKNIISLIKN